MQELINKIGIYILKEEEIDVLYNGISFLNEEEQSKVLEKIRYINEEAENLLEEIIEEIDKLSSDDKSILLEKIDKHVENIRNNKHKYFQTLNELNMDDMNFNIDMHNNLNGIVKLEHRELLYLKIQNYLLTKEKVKRIEHSYYRE